MAFSRLMTKNQYFSGITVMAFQFEADKVGRTSSRENAGLVSTSIDGAAQSVET